MTSSNIKWGVAHRNSPRSAALPQLVSIFKWSFPAHDVKMCPAHSVLSTCSSSRSHILTNAKPNGKRIPEFSVLGWTRMNAAPCPLDLCKKAVVRLLRLHEVRICQHCVLAKEKQASVFRKIIKNRQTKAKRSWHYLADYYLLCSVITFQ